VIVAMFMIRYVMSRIFVFWLSVAILVYGWFSHASLVNDGFSASEAFVKSLTKMDVSGKTETVIVHILHLGDLLVIGVIMLAVTFVLTALRNLVLGSGKQRMTVTKAVAHLLVLLVLAYVISRRLVVRRAPHQRLVRCQHGFDRPCCDRHRPARSVGPRLADARLATPPRRGVSHARARAGWEILKWALRGTRARLARSQASA